ncbi:MAG: acylneuraminate cytidylyltransferase family protein [Acidimicrobiales bacterium]
MPARGGSRGVPRKNIRDLGGHPLLAYTIAAARASERVSHLVVSTDDPEIAEVARAHGAEVVHRPAELATDEAPTAPVILHALELVEQATGLVYDFVLTLQPTTPFRRGTDIDAAVELLEAADDPDASVTSVVRIYDAHPVRMQRLDDGVLRPYIAGNDLPTRRQDLPPAYLRNGAIYLAHRHTVTGGSVWARREMPYEMPPEQSVNIDEPLDFLLAEAVARAQLTEVDLLRTAPPDPDPEA